MRAFLFILIVITAISCKKQYHCRCQTDVTFPSGKHEYYTNKNENISKKLTKKQAAAICKQEETSVNSTYSAFFSNNGNWTSGGFEAKTKCSVY